MFVSARVEYACLAMLELARQASDPKPVRLVDVASRHGIPQRFLVQIMLQMKGAGLVATTRGSSGGYRLAREPDEITLADILSALERAEAPEERDIIPSQTYRELQKIWRGLTDSHTAYLDQFRLTDLIPKEAESDYVI